MFPKAILVYEAAQLRKLMKGRTVTLSVHMANDCLDARLTQPSTLEVLRDAIHAKNDLSYYAETSGF